MTQRKTMAERNVLTVWPDVAARIKALCAEHPDNGDWQSYANNALREFLAEHRSNKPLVLPEERFSERNSEAEWSGVCL